MPTVKLPSPKMGSSVEELTALVFRYYRELQYVLENLDSDNVKELDANITRIKNLQAENIVTNTFVTNTLYAEYARIARLTVDELDTSFKKIVNFLKTDPNQRIAPINYIRIHDQEIEVYVTSTDGSQTEQVMDRDGNPLYWTDAAHKGFTDVANEYPILVFKYNEKRKLYVTCEPDPEQGGEYVTKIWLGAGTGVGNNGKSCIWKGTDGLYFDYYHTVTGELKRAKITDDTFDFGQIGKIIFNNGTTLQGIVQLFVETDWPEGSKDKDVLVDTDDYSRYDRQAISTSTTDTVDKAEFVEFTGSAPFTYNLSSAGATPGCIKKLKNSSTAIITIATTIDGTTGKILYPGEPADLIWNGTDWRSV